MQITLNELTVKQQAYLAKTILDNPYIPHDPFFEQCHFLADTSEEAFYGGQAGGGKSDALLMGSLQYVTDDYIIMDDKREHNPYKALLIRRTLDDLDMPNAIMDRAKQWLLPFENTGDLIFKDLKKQFRFSNGATLTFRYLYHDKHLDKYQGAEFDYIGFDELTQFTEKQYTYLHSRIRESDTSVIPGRMRSASNPGGIGHEWVKKRFVDKNSKLPFISSAYTDNMFINQEAYAKRLDKITDELTRQQLKYGNWELVLSSGLLMDLVTFNKRKILYQDFKDWTPVYTAIGIDPASTGDDRFSMACLCYFDNGKLVLVDLDSTTSSKPEHRLINFIRRNQRYYPRVINFEREQGSSPHYALQYWQNLLLDLSTSMGFYVTDTPASSTGSKYNRAYPVAYHIRNGTMLINSDIPVLHEGYEVYNPVDEYGNQLVYLHPDKDVMKQHRSPDESDSVSFAFEKLQESIGALALGA